MQHYIECKVRYQKTMEDGTEKMVNEPYWWMPSASQKQRAV